VKPFLELLSSQEAYALIDGLPKLSTEVFPAGQSVGHVLAEAIHAIDDIPHFFRSNMDGFAVRAQDTIGASASSAKRLSVSGSVPMGVEATAVVGPQQAVRVSTGAMMPAGADAVVIVENTEEPVEGEILVRSQVQERQNTVAIGEDMHNGDLVFSPGHRIRPSDRGVLSGVGVLEIVAHRRARIAVVATGDEIVEPGQELAPGQVRNVNQYLMAEMSRSLGNPVLDFGVIPDREEDFARVLATAQQEADLLFVSGGSSRGARDLTVDAVQALPGAETLFHGLAIAPGKPTLLAVAAGLTVMGLPGNPAAAAVVLHLFGKVLAASLEGESVARVLLRRPRVRAQMGTSVSSTAGREDFLRVSLNASPDGQGLPVAQPALGKSVAISTIARADGLVAIPPSTEGLEQGAEVDVVLL
jgi:molybdopterin molybdotransferase